MTDCSRRTLRTRATEAGRVRRACDPMHPTPTTGGSTCRAEDTIPVSMGPRDEHPNECHQDELCCTSKALAWPLEATGPVKAVLCVVSSTPDTDFAAKLVDVRPDG